MESKKNSANKIFGALNSYDKERSPKAQLAINMGAQAVTFLTGLVISFFFTPYIVKKVSSEAYGFVGLANNFTSYVQIITTALNSMAGRFITISIHREEYEKSNKYFSSLLFANVIICIPITVLSVFTIIFLDKLVNISSSLLPDVRVLWALIFASFIIGLVLNVFSVATFSKNRLDLSSMRSIESSLIRIIILVVMFAVFKPSVWYLGLSALVCGLYVSLTNVYYTKKLLPFIKIRRSFFDKAIIKELISSGMWNSLSALSRTLSSGLDLLITNLFVSSVAMGTVSISKNVPSLILSAFGTIAAVFMPQLTISYAKNDYEDIKTQLISSVKLLGFVACIPMAFLYAFGKEFYSLWMPTEDASLLQMLSILSSLAFPFVLPLEPLWNIFTVTNKIKQSSLFLLSNAVASVLIVFLMLKFTTNETMKMYIVVGVSSVIGIIRALTFLPIYGARALKFKWYTFYPVMGKTVLSVVVSTGVMLAIKQLLTIDSWFMLIVAGALTAGISSVINFFLLLGKTERKLLTDKIMSKLKRA